MEYLDLDSFRSRYSDITVTAVPAKRPKIDPSDGQPTMWNAAEQNAADNLKMTPVARVEITAVGPTNAAAAAAGSNQQPQQLPQTPQQDAAYSNEYKQVLAKLEYTKYIQAQLQLMSTSNVMGAGAGAFGELLYGLSGSNMQLAQAEASCGTSNIVDIYDNLLGVIGEMQSNLGPTAIGLRAPKERLLRDIAHARVLVRECILMLMRDQQQRSCEQ